MEEQLKYYFEECDLAGVLESSCNRQSHDGKIRDIVDGTEYLRVKVPGKYNLVLVMNTDGVSIRNSSPLSFGRFFLLYVRFQFT